MAKVIQLKLDFVGASSPTPAANVCAAEGVAFDTCAMYDEMALRQGVTLKPYGPCKSCPLQGLCDADDCGMKCFHLDSNKSDQGSWNSYFERQKSQVRSWLESHPFYPFS